MLDLKQSKTLLQRSLLSHVFEVLWRSALLTAVVMMIHYLLGPETFEFSHVWIISVAATILVSIGKFLNLLMAAARYRKRRDGDDDH